MIPPKRLPEFKKGQILKASDMMALRDAITRQRLTTGQSSGVTLSETPDCTTIRIDAARPGSVGLSNGITARVGTTPGTGSVKFYSYNSNTDKLVDQMAKQDPVKNFSTSVIPSGKYCWVEPDESGTWWVVSAEC